MNGTKPKFLEDVELPAGYYEKPNPYVDATDGSKELCKIAGEYAGVQVKQMLFEELDAVEEYDGVWACASILHVEKKQLPDILGKIAAATKKGDAPVAQRN